MNNAPSTLVKPSSLNYKISLCEAVLDFNKKELPLQEDQFIDVHTEDPKQSQNNNNQNGSTEGGKKSNAEHNFEDFDDTMFDMTVTNNQRGANGIN